MHLKQIRTGAFQGQKKRKRCFEGWYFKHTAQDGRTYAVIPGISRADGRDHAFIQIVDGMNGTSHYITCGMEEFSADRKELHIRIGSSRFSSEGITLDIRSPEITVSGTLSYGPLSAFPVLFASLGIMERCIHESVESSVRVTLKSADGTVLFDSCGDPAGFELFGDISGFL